MKTYYIVWLGLRGRKQKSGYDFPTLEEAKEFAKKRKYQEPTLTAKIEKREENEVCEICGDTDQGKCTA